MGGPSDGETAMSPFVDGYTELGLSATDHGQGMPAKPHISLIRRNTILWSARTGV